MYVLDQNKKIRYTLSNFSFTNIKLGFKGVYTSRTCFPDDFDTVDLCQLT